MIVSSFYSDGEEFKVTQGECSRPGNFTNLGCVLNFSICLLNIFLMSIVIQFYCASWFNFVLPLLLIVFIKKMRIHRWFSNILLSLLLLLLPWLCFISAYDVTLSIPLEDAWVCIVISYRRTDDWSVYVHASFFYIFLSQPVVTLK